MIEHTVQSHGPKRLWYLVRLMIVVAALMVSPVLTTAIFGPDQGVNTASGAVELLVIICAYLAICTLMFQRLRWVLGWTPVTRAMAAFGVGIVAYIVLVDMFGPVRSVVPSVLLSSAAALLVGLLPARGRASYLATTDNGPDIPSLMTERNHPIEDTNPLNYGNSPGVGSLPMGSQQGVGGQLNVAASYDIVSAPDFAVTHRPAHPDAPAEPASMRDPVRDKRQRSLVGTARNVRRGERQPDFFTQHFVQGGQTMRQMVLSFRLELTNDVGDVVDYRQVEMVGDVVRGDLIEGDTVEIPIWTEIDGVVVPEAAFNRSSSSLVTAQVQEGARRFAAVKLVARIIYGIVFFIIFGIVMTYIIVGFVRFPGGFP